MAAVRGSAVGAGMNMLLAADLRIVANDARLLCGFLKRGMHPGGGHFVILSLFGIIFLFGHLPTWNYAIGFTTALLVTGIMLLELFVAVLQAYVFALLSSIFIGMMQQEHH